MTIRCVNRPNRSGPRHWTARNAITAACSAIEHGADPDEIHAGIDDCSVEHRKRAKEDVPLRSAAEADALEMAKENILQNSELLDADAQFLDRFIVGLTVTGVVLLLISRLPLIGRVLSRALAAFSKAATERRTEVHRQQSANAAMLTVIRRAQESARRASKELATVE